MKNFFSNLFGRNNDPKSIVSFDVLNAIYSYLYNVNDQIEFKMKGVHHTVVTNLFTFPSAFNYEQAKNEFEKSGLKDAYGLLNELYQKIDIGALSQEEIEKGLEYDYIHIQFYSEPPARIKKDLKHIFHNFIIFFCCTNSLETNDFRILYTSDFFMDYVKGIRNAQFIDIKNPQNDVQEIGFKEFEKVLQAICQYINIEIPESVELPSTENLIEDEEVTVETFEEFINLVSRGNADDKLVKKQSKKLLKNFKKGPENYYETVEAHWGLFDSVDCWNSDWKFDPEDAEYFISEMIGHDLNFAYPEETFSHNLFPYIQSALEKLDLELMTYDTHGDNYLFFVANKNDVGRILALSELTKIEVNQL
ncbi:hypothetical protein SD960_03835 [Flavobacterium sp. MMLR14_040]|uniref:DUF6630 family protein n=1 Tax=Flavobacterium sp. MMLR14_040 TaxID=3093843 RepID=UPI00298FED21|nr:hypothetical protein [Flavobacterium sp. MMLR14_040]MDW8849209.1 hypothetical protein [Flavobacterium sp. MMLR14_040]